MSLSGEIRTSPFGKWAGCICETVNRGGRNKCEFYNFYDIFFYFWQSFNNIYIFLFPELQRSLQQRPKKTCIVKMVGTRTLWKNIVVLCVTS